MCIRDRDILSVEPAHAKVIAICISTGTKIWCQYLIIVSIVVLSQAGCTEMVTAVAMQGNYPIMGFAIWIINTIAVNIIFSWISTVCPGFSARKASFASC